MNPKRCVVAIMNGYLYKIKWIDFNMVNIIMKIGIKWIFKIVLLMVTGNSIK